MKNPKWHLFNSLLVITLIVATIYAGGFILLRMKFVEIQNYTDGGVVYFSEDLAMNPRGLLGFTIDFYKPAFLVETKYYGANNLVINGWVPGMRTWEFTPRSDH